MHLSRIAEDLIILNSDGFNLINLSDKIVTGSSIMPQKNPDLLEYLRGKTGSLMEIYLHAYYFKRLASLVLQRSSR